MLQTAIYEISGPVAVRYPKGTDGVYRDSQWENRCSPNSSFTIVTYGSSLNPVLSAVSRLAQEQIEVDVIKLDQICPLQLNDIMRSVSVTHKLLVVEEVMQTGCVGEQILASFAQRGICCRSRLLNLGEAFVAHGDLNALRKQTGIDQDSIYEKAKELLYEE